MTINLTPSQSKRLANHWSPKHRPLVLRCWNRQAGPQGAIKCQCLDCQGGDLEAVRACADRCCPLWRYRPGQSRPSDPAKPKRTGAGLAAWRAKQAAQVAATPQEAQSHAQTPENAFQGQNPLSGA